MARHQSSQLKSDMQAFKAANPGCALEDFVRWHSPRDWITDQTDETDETDPASAADPNAPGRLSDRFGVADNLWSVLWKVCVTTRFVTTLFVTTSRVTADALWPVLR